MTPNKESMNRDKWEKELTDLFDGKDGSLFPTWLLCETNESQILEEPLGFPSDCACCLDVEHGRDGIPGCGCVCHRRLRVLKSFIRSLLDQQRQEIIEKVAVEKNNTHPWETDNHICKWCGANYTSAEIHATKHDYGS